jgi:hypothetical protein
LVHSRMESRNVRRLSACRSGAANLVMLHNRN